MLPSSIAGILRHVLTFGGGFLAQSGLIETSQVDVIAGAVITLIGVVWSVVHKKKVA